MLVALYTICLTSVGELSKPCSTSHVFWRLVCSSSQGDSECETQSMEASMRKEKAKVRRETQDRWARIESSKHQSKKQLKTDQPTLAQVRQAND